MSASVLKLRTSQPYPLCFAALSALCGAWHLYRDAAHALCSNSIHVTNSRAIDLVVWVRVLVWWWCLVLSDAALGDRPSDDAAVVPIH